MRRLFAFFEYDSLTGTIKSKKDFRRRKEGEDATIKNGDYRCIIYRGRYYPAHRIAWLLYYKNLPEWEIDHINGIRDDNRIVNLRDVPQQVNAKNRKIYSTNSSGAAGVTKAGLKYRATIRHNGKNINLGRFNNIDEASLAYQSKKIELGYHPNHGALR